MVLSSGQDKTYKQKRESWLTQDHNFIKKTCNHPGCKNHKTHPCEVCGGIGYIKVPVIPKEAKWSNI